MDRNSRGKIEVILRTFLAISILFIGISHPIKDSETLIRKMLNKYEGKWYKTLTFNQQTTRYDVEGNITSDQVWYEAMRLPDQLLIKINDIKGGNGMLFRNDSLYQFENGEVAGSRPMIHPLLVLGFSVYAQPLEKTISDLNALEFDLSKFHKREFEGKQYYVVGADAGDETSNQFWIEKDRLLFTRLIQDFGDGRKQDIRFNDYQKLVGGWVAAEVLFYSNNELRLKEIYTKIHSPELDQSIFEISSFVRAKW